MCVCYNNQTLSTSFLSHSRVENQSDQLSADNESDNDVLHNCDGLLSSSCNDNIVLAKFFSSTMPVLVLLCLGLLRNVESSTYYHSKLVEARFWWSYDQIPMDDNDNPTSMCSAYCESQETLKGICNAFQVKLKSITF